MMSRERVTLRVVRQFLEAALFEGLVPFRCTDRTADSWQCLQFRLGDVHGECLGRVRGFSRIRLNMESLTLTRQGQAVPPELACLTEQLAIPPRQRNTLLRELQATIRNALLYDRPPESRRDLPAEQLDCALHEGHPYHPCFKARSGFSHEDQLRFGPESGRSFRLQWVAVRRDQCRIEVPLPEDSFWRQELGTETAYLLRAAFHRVGADWNRHTALPLHPWQWQSLKNEALVPALARGDVRPLGLLGDRYRASQSLRSLFNQTHPEAACVKTSLGIGNTSSRRHLEPHSVPSAPAISRWLEETVSADDQFTHRYPLRLMTEYASLLYIGNPEQPAEQQALAGEMGVIWRTGVQTLVRHHERAVPVNALPAVEADGLPFIAPWLERHGLQAWLRATIRTLVLPVWHLLVRHGIGVEAHAQNSLMVLQDGWPTALILRDFHDSVEYVADFLPAGNPGPDLGERQRFYDEARDDRYYRMGQVEALRELVMDTLFVFNLSELAHCIEVHYGFPETRFWRLVHQCLQTYAQQQPQLASRLARIGHQRSRIATESLLARKLRGPDAGECHHDITNTLAVSADVYASSDH